MNNPENQQVKREERRITPENITDWRVLLVDDEQDNLIVIDTVLRYHGAEVQTARNGEAGLRLLEQFPATVILTDLSMPEMSGWELLLRVRQNPATAHIPMIALTAHAMKGDETRVLTAGFNGYIPKPFSVATIVQNIQSILQRL